MEENDFSTAATNFLEDQVSTREAKAHNRLMESPGVQRSEWKSVRDDRHVFEDLPS